MRILYIFPFIPYPPTDGGKTVCYNLLKYLSQKHQVTLATTYRDESEVANLGPLEEICEKVLIFKRPKRWHWRNCLKAALGIPFPIATFSVPRMKSGLSELFQKQQFDTVQVDYYFMRQNLPDNLLQPLLLHNIVLDKGLYANYAKRSGNPLVKLAYRILSCQSGRWELKEWNRADLNVAITPDLAREMKQLGYQGSTEIQLPGVDVDYFSPGEDSEQGDADLVFVGAMRYPPNVDAMVYFCREVLPLIREKRPDVRTWIVGQHPVPEVKALANEPNVTVTGFVDDVRPYWRKATVAVLPLRIGGGVRLKMLEALSMGKPIVTTEAGAEGSGAKAGEEFLQAESSEEMRDQILRLLDDKQLRGSLERKARDAAVNRYSWQVCGQNFEKLHEKLLSLKQN